MEITDEQLEAVAQVAEKANNLLGSLALPLPAHIHLQGLGPNIQEMRDELRRLVVEVKGEDPWEGHPGWR
jgi:archaellum component FlaC